MACSTLILLIYAPCRRSHLRSMELCLITRALLIVKGWTNTSKTPCNWPGPWRYKTHSLCCSTTLRLSILTTTPVFQSLTPRILRSQGWSGQLCWREKTGRVFRRGWSSREPIRMGRAEKLGGSFKGITEDSVAGFLSLVLHWICAKCCDSHLTQGK